MLSANCFNLNQSKILSSGNGLTTPGKKLFPKLSLVFDASSFCRLQSLSIWTGLKFHDLENS